MTLKMWEMGKSITRKSGPHSFRGTGCIGSSTKRSVENKVGILIDEISEFTCSQTGVLTPSSSLSLYGSQDSKQYFPRWPLMRQIHLYICDKKIQIQNVHISKLNLKCNLSTAISFAANCLAFAPCWFSVFCA